MPIPLRWALIVPFLLQITAAVGVTGYLSWRNGHRAVEDLASQLHEAVSHNVEHELSDFLHTPALVNSLNVDAAERGDLNLTDAAGWQRYLLQQVQRFEDIDYVMFGSPYLGLIGLQDLGNRGFAYRSRDGQWSEHGAIVEQVVNAQGTPSLWQRIWQR